MCLLLGAWWVLFDPTNKEASSVVINEFMASNGTGLTDEDGDYPDWIEIYNPGTMAINLSGWSLTDDPNQPEKWTLPDIVLGSHEYLVVFASGKNRKSAWGNTELHTNFKLGREGEFLGLYNILYQRWMDVISPHFPEQFRDLSYGRYGDKLAYGYLAAPTPGGPNDETLVWKGVVDKVDFSAERGFYSAPFAVELRTGTTGATIFYTTDGTEPGETNGMKYYEPINVSETTSLRAVAVKPDYRPSYMDTYTYIFLDDVLTQSTPLGYPSFDYEMDPEVVNDPRYRDTIRHDLRSIPTMSVVTDVKNLYDLHENSMERGEAWERPVSVELIYPGDSRKGFQINAGYRIHGGVGRLRIIPKHSFRLYFRGKYGATNLQYPLFPDSPVEDFDTIVLRGGVNRTYAISEGDMDPRLVTYTRDEWLRASQIALSGLGSHGAFVHLYLNGLYWGLYNVVERPDASFMSSYLGGREEDWYVRNDGGALSGSSDRFEELLEFANSGGLDEPERYAAFGQYIDITHFIDYVLLNWYAGNEDWPDNNWYVAVQNPGGWTQFFAWDGERTWVDGARVSLAKETGSRRKNVIKRPFLALMQNSDFSLALADRMYKHLYNDGALTDSNSQARWVRVNNMIDRAIVGESARWGDTRYGVPITRDDWLKARDDVLAQMDGNAAKLIGLAREAGYYPDIAPPAFNRHGGLVRQGFELTMEAPRGTIYYTSDGSDPRVQGSGEVGSSALVYNSPLVLTTTTHVKARVLDGSTWSAQHEATFKVVEHDRQLRITELMYNPSDGGDLEFIELKNTGEGELDLSNMYFSGIRFTFPPSGRSLAPGEFVVLVRNSVVFGERYPDVVIGGVYAGQLSNQGEEIALKDIEGNLVISLAYDDENGWPISPDGRGDSLVLVNPDGDPDDPRNWRASVHLNGSPGVDEPEAW
jgi:hypothetical protein